MAACNKNGRCSYLLQGHAASAKHHDHSVPEVTVNGTGLRLQATTYRKRQTHQMHGRYPSTIQQAYSNRVVQSHRERTAQRRHLRLQNEDCQPT